MSTHKIIDLVCVVVTLLAVLITVLFINGEHLGITPIIDEDAEANSGSVYFTANDLNADWDTSGATRITLKGDSASVSGPGAYAYNGSVYISGAGRFVITGTLTDGSVIVDAKRSSKVWILLDGADIYCSDSAALQVLQADKVFLTLAEGSVNSFADGAAHSDAALEDGIKGAVFAADDLTINGSGSLTINGAYRHGIDANDDLVITGGSITIDGARDAIHVNDSLRVCNASLTLTALDEGVDVDAEGGYLYVESGTLVIDSVDDGIHTEGDILIAGGDITIRTVDDGIHGGTNLYIYGGTVDIEDCYEGLEAQVIELHGGDVTIYPVDDGVNANGFVLANAGSLEANYAVSAEETYVLVAGGSLTIINTEAEDADGIDSNGSLYITGGSVFISLPDSGTNTALDYGSESGGTALVSGGTVVACGSYSMAEAFDSASEQCSILYNISAGAQAGTQVRLLDADGSALIDATIPGSFSSVILSCPEMALGETYTVVIGDNAEEITLTEASAAYGDARSAMFGGSMNWGGMQPHGGFGGRGDETGERPEMPTDGQRPDLGDLPDITLREDTLSAGTADGAAETDAQTLAVRQTLVLVSVLVLELGIIIAVVFRKKIAL